MARTPSELWGGGGSVFPLKKGNIFEQYFKIRICLHFFKFFLYLYLRVSIVFVRTYYIQLFVYRNDGNVLLVRSLNS